MLLIIVTSVVIWIDVHAMCVIHASIQILTHPFICPFIHPFIHLSIYLSNHSLSHSSPDEDGGSSRSEEEAEPIEKFFCQEAFTSSQ